MQRGDQNTAYVFFLQCNIHTLIWYETYIEGAECGMNMGGSRACIQYSCMRWGFRQHFACLGNFPTTTSQLSIHPSTSMVSGCQLGTNLIHMSNVGHSENLYDTIILIHILKLYRSVCMWMFFFLKNRMLNCGYWKMSNSSLALFTPFCCTLRKKCHCISMCPFK